MAGKKATAHKGDNVSTEFKKGGNPYGHRKQPKPDARSFATGAKLGGGDFNTQMVGPKPKHQRKATTAVAGGKTWGTIPNYDGANRAGSRPLGAIPHGMPAQYMGEGGDPPEATGTSIFDPVICEIAYRWFCPPGGRVLDPFAGGSVRGIVASRLGLAYTGIELRPEQIAANKAQLAIAGDPKPRWLEGDARNIASQSDKKLLKAADRFDLVFSCPPYWNLEVYSEDPRDLSTMDREAFFAAQAEIIAASIERLADNRFAVWIVGDVRDHDGYYVNLPGRTIAAFETAGAKLYNEAILVTAVGSLPVRVGKQFVSGRKLGKTHQNVLVFCKGDWRKATEACGEVVEFGEIDAAVGDGADGGFDVLPDFTD